MTFGFNQGHRVTRRLKHVQLLLYSGFKWPNLLHWFIIQGRWLQRSHVSMANVADSSICSSCSHPHFSVDHVMLTFMQFHMGQRKTNILYLFSCKIHNNSRLKCGVLLGHIVVIKLIPVCAMNRFSRATTETLMISFRNVCILVCVQ